jgi:hypothetical protein
MVCIPAHGSSVVSISGVTRATRALRGHVRSQNGVLARVAANRHPKLASKMRNAAHLVLAMVLRSDRSLSYPHRWKDLKLARASLIQ